MDIVTMKHQMKNAILTEMKMEIAIAVVSTEFFANIVFAMIARLMAQIIVLDDF